MIPAAEKQIAAATPEATPRTVGLSLAPLAPGVKAKPNTPELVKKELHTLVVFVDTFCHAKHGDRPQLEMKSLNVAEIAGKPVCLCTQCTKLLQHALVKRTHCPREMKPACKHCPTHCYAPTYRQQIREVMAFSGRHLLLRGRVDYLWHLFF